ncbi:MAG: DoxX family protein [Roseococcus sp.]|nr:DoxX family protein [Roseococcus sp.]
MQQAETSKWKTILVNLVAWLAAIWIACEMLFYLQYKLTGPTLVFERLSDWSGVPEKPFRLFVAGMEIVAAILVMIPRLQGPGGLFTMGIMGGAIFFHIFTPLTIDPYEDGGKLFQEACFTFLMGAVLAWLRREQILAWLPRRLATALAA